MEYQKEKWKSRKWIVAIVTLGLSFAGAACGIVYGFVYEDSSTIIASLVLLGGGGALSSGTYGYFNVKSTIANGDNDVA